MNDALRLAALQLERGAHGGVQQHSSVVLGRYQLEVPEMAPRAAASRVSAPRAAVTRPAAPRVSAPRVLTPRMAAPGVAKAVAQANRQHLPHALTAGLGATLAHAPRLLKHRGVLLARVRGVAQAVAGSTSQHLPRVLSAGVRAALAQSLRLLKLKDTLATRFLGNTLPGPGAAVAAASAASSAARGLSPLMPSHLGGSLSKAAIVASSLLVDHLIRHHVAPRIAKLQLDGQLGRASHGAGAWLAHHRAASAPKPDLTKPDLTKPDLTKPDLTDAAAHGSVAFQIWELALLVLGFLVLAYAAWLTFLASTPKAGHLRDAATSRLAVSGPLMPQVR